MSDGVLRRHPGRSPGLGLQGLCTPMPRPRGRVRHVHVVNIGQRSATPALIRSSPPPMPPLGEPRTGNFPRFGRWFRRSNGRGHRSMVRRSDHGRPCICEAGLPHPLRALGDSRDYTTSFILWRLDQAGSCFERLVEGHADWKGTVAGEFDDPFGIGRLFPGLLSLNCRRACLGWTRIRIGPLVAFTPSARRREKESCGQDDPSSLSHNDSSHELRLTSHLLPEGPISRYPLPPVRFSLLQQAHSATAPERQGAGHRPVVIGNRVLPPHR
jgi:hypothetical protein